MIRITAVLLVVCALAAPARAEDKARARELFRQGTQHYKLGEYEDALTAFKEAYRNYEEPSFLFNIAQCERQLGRKQEAVRFFRTYLNDVPNAPNRAEVEQILASLQASIERDRAQAAAHPAAPAATPPATAQPLTPAPAAPAVASRAPASQPVYKRWWLWTAVGGAVAVGLGVGLGVALAPGPSAPSASSSLGTFHF